MEASEIKRTSRNFALLMTVSMVLMYAAISFRHIILPSYPYQRTNEEGLEMFGKLMLFVLPLYFLANYMMSAYLKAERDKPTSMAIEEMKRRSRIFALVMSLFVVLGSLLMAFYPVILGALYEHFDAGFFGTHPTERYLATMLLAIPAYFIGYKVALAGFKQKFGTEAE